MVYRLYRASRSLMARIFVVVLIYSIIIGVIGFLFLGIVVSFDAQSFNPNLIDINNQSSANGGLICDAYNSPNCNWYLYNDVPQSLLNKNISIQLNDLKARMDSENVVLLQESLTSTTFLARAVAYVEANAFTTYQNYTILPSGPLVDQNNSVNLCFSLLRGEGCQFGGTTQPFFRLIPNLNVFSNNKGEFLGTNVLIANNSQNNVICKSFPNNCPYYQSKNGTYTYYGPTTGSLQTRSNVSAYEALITPNPTFTTVGNLQNIKSSIGSVCEYDYGGCASLNIYQNNFQFVFLDSNNNIRTGSILLTDISSPGNDFFNLNNNFGSLGCFSTNQNQATFEINETAISCNPEGVQTNTVSSKSSSVGYNLITFPLSNPGSSTNPSISFSIFENSINVKFVLLIRSQTQKPTFEILGNILTHPKVFIDSYSSSQIMQDVIKVVLIFFIVNLVLSFLMIILRMWKRIGNFISFKSTSLLRGRIGSLLELTQFFDFGGNWYLEAHGVYDYNFKSTMGVVHELINERWRDTIFFPTALAATISIFVFSVWSDPSAIFSLFVFGGLLPLLLAFWIPALWIIQDSGLKRAEWTNNGELQAIEKISAIIRDGFNKLVGFGAIFGIGTAGASVFRAKIQGSTVSSSSAFSGGLSSLLDFNGNFLFSAILWTISLLCIVTAVSLTGNVLTSLSYLNSDHLANVKKLRTSLQKKEIFLGTTQQAMDYGSQDTSVYFDSKKGIDDAIMTETPSKPSMPVNQIISEMKFQSEDELTQIIITNPKDSEVEVKPISKELKQTPEKNSESQQKSSEQDQSQQTEEPNTNESNNSTNTKDSTEETKQNDDSNNTSTSDDASGNQ